MQLRLRSFLLVSALTLVTASHAGAANLDSVQAEKPYTVWLLGPLSLEKKLSPEGTLSLAAGFSGVIYDDGLSTGVAYGWMVEAQSFKNTELRGQSFGLRVGQAEGITYVAPIFSYTSRPKRNVSFRASALAPFGRDITPFSLEIGIGFRF
jgi:hypothetical protein